MGLLVTNLLHRVLSIRYRKRENIPLCFCHSHTHTANRIEKRKKNHIFFGPLSGFDVYDDENMELRTHIDTVCFSSYRYRIDIGLLAGHLFHLQFIKINFPQSSIQKRIIR